MDGGEDLLREVVLCKITGLVTNTHFISGVEFSRNSDKSVLFTNSLFMCQDKGENEDENEGTGISHSYAVI